MSRGPKPQPDRPRSRHNAALTEKVKLPASGCDLPAPDMPAVREWSEFERQVWNDLWASPQATQWDDSNVPTVAAMIVYYVAILRGEASAWEAQEYRHSSGSLGLTPAGMKLLGWVIDDDE